jgi:hypothetical protein
MEMKNKILLENNLIEYLFSVYAVFPMEFTCEGIFLSRRKKLGLRLTAD